LVGGTIGGNHVAVATSSFVQTDGLRIHYRQEGTGAPVVLLHGFPQTSHQWRHQLAFLGEHYAVHAPDNRGFGLTDKPDVRVTRQLLARDVVRFLDALDIERAHLVGHDWGGIIAFAVAASHPERVDRLALLDTLCTVWFPLGLHGYWFKTFDQPEAFFAEHAATFVEVLFGGRDAGDLPPLPDSPWPIPPGPRPRPSWIDDEALDHYREALSDRASQRAAISYYRHGLPFHLGEDGRFRFLEPAEVAAMWLHPGGLAEHPHGRDYPVFAPEDFDTVFPRPTLWLHGNYLGRRGGAAQGDETIPAGNPFLDQFSRHFPDLRARAVACGHFIPEEAPDYTNETLLAFLRGEI
jgi:pimeloyl-ACP methyl ester carboxylesterase